MMQDYVVGVLKEVLGHRIDWARSIKVVLAAKCSVSRNKRPVWPKCGALRGKGGGRLCIAYCVC